MLLPLLVLLLTVLGGYLAWQSSYWWRRNVAGPGGWPLVGNMWQFALGWRSYGEVYAELYNKHSTLRYVGIYRLFNEPAVLVREQRLLRELLVGGSFTHCADNALCLDVQRDPLAAQNPFVACGERWRQRRGELVPLFTPHRLRQTLPHITAACLQLRQYIANRLDHAKFEAKELATRYTLQVIASAVFGLDAQCLHVEEHTTNSPGAKQSEWLHFLAPLFQPSAWSLAETIALLHSPSLGWLMGYRYVPLKLELWLCRLVAAKRQGQTLLNWLWERQAKQEKQGSSDVAGPAATLLLEGYETSAMLLAFALYELARNQNVQRRLHRELAEVAERHAGQLLTHAALEELPYADATLYETLRLHPAMQALQKRCTTSFTLPAQTELANAAGAAVRVPQGMVLVVPVQAIHLDAGLYRSPLSFRPERFMQPTQPIGGCFLGFGAGPRMCPGMRFGLSQTKAALVTLLQDYHIRLANEQQQTVEKSAVTFLTASKAGIWLRLQPR